MFGTLGLQEILIVLVIGIIVFGVFKMPKIVRSLGSGVKQFQKFRNVVKNPLDHIDDLMGDEPSQNQQQNYGPNPNQQGHWQGGSPQGPKGAPGEPEEGGEQKSPERDNGDA
jgi:sec-independent protein translocase protein TatA